MSTPAGLRVDLPMDELRAFCAQWNVERLAVFGSALRDDFGPESDIDFIAWFAADARMSAFDHVRLENELSELLGRRAEVVHREALDRDHSSRRRQRILDSAVAVVGA
ncbi:MAG: nucleotidyltransferase domain-containing protein [Dehalococcoidia bacterium]|nr:nucleotidyltransferase domain-containing protein [Dehalococcoidia bacterium]